MNILDTKDGKEIWYHQIERPFVLVPPFPGQRYVAIVFANDESVTDEERRTLTRSLFATGCRYGVFAGHASSEWELALDMAYMESDPDYDPPEEDFTMTTSYGGESINDVLFFGLMCTSFGSHDFDRFLILSVGLRVGFLDEVEVAIRSVWYESA